MLIIAALILVAPLAEPVAIAPNLSALSDYTKKKKRSSTSGTGRRYKSCEEARKAGVTHMRRGQAGYSQSLDRDGDGVACDKVK
jgi:Excalibur calcium-binding domain